MPHTVSVYIYRKSNENAWLWRIDMPLNSLRQDHQGQIEAQKNE